MRPVISAVPPSNGKSAPLPFTRASGRRRGRAGCRRRRTSSRSPPGRRPRRRRGPGAGRSSLPLPGVGHPVHAEQRPAAPRQGAHGRRDGVGAQERQALAVLGEVLGERRGVGREDEPGGIGRPLRAERGEDRVGLGLDELERLVPLARAGEDGRDLGTVRGRGGAAELGDRHDRDVGQRPGRRRGRGGGRLRRRRLGRGSVARGLGRVDGRRRTRGPRSRDPDGPGDPAPAPPKSSMPPVTAGGWRARAGPRTTSRGRRSRPGL